MHGEWAGWEALRVWMEDCCGNKGDMVVDGKVLQLGCGCDSTG